MKLTHRHNKLEKRRTARRGARKLAVVESRDVSFSSFHVLFVGVLV